MAVIPAHNEENVIGDILDSLKKQNYNKQDFNRLQRT